MTKEEILSAFEAGMKVFTADSTGRCRECAVLRGRPDMTHSSLLEGSPFREGIRRVLS